MSADGQNGGAPGARTALIADDDSAVRQLLRTALEGRFKVLEARNGRDALKIVSTLRTPPDIAIFDVVMPVMSGLEAISWLRQLAPKTPVVAITCGNPAHADFLAVAARLGAAGGLVKPFSPEALTRLADRLTAA